VLVTPDIPAEYISRPLRLEDAERVVDLTAAYQARVLGEVLVEIEDVHAAWKRPSSALGDFGCAVLDGERMVACGEVRADDCDAVVHPDHWGRGIGGAIARWSWHVARARGQTSIGQTVPDVDVRAATLFAALGYHRGYSSWILALPPDATIPEHPLPGGYLLRDFAPGRDEQATYQLVESAFGEWEGRTPQQRGEWAAEVLGRPGFVPELLRLVQDAAGAVVAACVLQLSGDIGWVHQLAVARPHRGRGLAQALLADAFATARRHGRARVELSTDSRTRALGAYERAGMRIRSSFTHWRKQL
jgi:GNAT superfamily N-acetyltransferase